MGLIARHLEANGIATVVLTSSIAITSAVNPPRAAYLDYPLGHTAGPPDGPRVQEQIVALALSQLRRNSPGSMLRLPFHWDDNDDWKDRVMREGDDRTARHDAPQYQHADDAAAADPACPTCIWT
ncbi:MAG: hypothetical protein AAF515_10555 [Pseudomonadota bacterium]